MFIMKIQSALPAFLAVCALVAGVRAQTPVAPATPAPAVATIAAPAPNQTIYTPRLPTATELTNVATAQGLTVDRIEETAAQITVVYKLPSGQTNTVAYRLLPTSGTVAPGNAVAVTTPAPAVVYERAPRVVYVDPYYDSYGPDYYYAPRYYYPPVSLSLGFGFRSGGFYGGGFRGGFSHRGR